MAEIEKNPSVVAPPSGSCGEVEGRDQGASPSGAGSRKPSPSVSASGFDPSRVALLPLDDDDRSFNDSALPSVMIWAGGEAYDELTAAGTADRMLDLDSCALAVGIYRAMTAAASKALPPAPGIDTEGQNPKGSGAKHESPIDEVEAPASFPPTPPGDLIQVAREAAAWAYRDVGMLLYAAEARDGKRDGSVPVQAALRALHRQEKVEDRPEGWVLVPREPRPEMIAAFWRIKNRGSLDVEATGEDRSDYAAYRAMLSASPRPSHERQG